MQAVLRISFSCALRIRGGYNVAEVQDLVGMFAYRLVTGHKRVRTAMAGIGEEGTVTTAGMSGLSMVTGAKSGGRSGWTWHALPCASMWGGSGRGG